MKTTLNRLTIWTAVGFDSFDLGEVEASTEVKALAAARCKFGSAIVAFVEKSKRKAEAEVLAPKPSLTKHERKHLKALLEACEECSVEVDANGELEHAIGHLRNVLEIELGIENTD